MKLIWDAISDFIEDNCMQLAAALTFYTLLSITPLLVLTISIASLFVSPADVQGEVESIAQSVMGPKGGEQLKALMSSGEVSGESTVARIVSIVVLIFGATGVMAQLQSSLNRIWEVRVKPDRNSIKNFILKRVLSFGMIMAIAFVLLVSLVVTTGVRAVADHFSGVLDSQAAQLAIGEGATLLTVILVFAAMFKVLPDAKIAWRDVWFGAAVTAVLFTTGKFLIGLYLGSQDLGSTYGAASSLVLFLLWTYYSSIILFFGTELTQMWARHQGRAIEPSDGAMRISERKGTEPSASKAA